jgi:SPP1 family predicted phage head-tail adaptor
MRIGKLDQRVTIQQRTQVRGAMGGHTFTWGTLAAVWARVEAVGSGEAREGDKPVGRARFLVTIRHRADVTAEHRVSWGSRVLQIEGVESVHARERSTALRCVETQDDP